MISSFQPVPTIFLKNMTFLPIFLFEFKFEYLIYFIQTNKAKFLFFYFSQNSLRGSPPKKFLEHLCRVKGEFHANFGRDSSSSLGSIR